MMGGEPGGHREVPKPMTDQEVTDALNRVYDSPDVESGLDPVLWELQMETLRRELSRGGDRDW